LIKSKHQPLTHAYAHWLADVHLAGFAPAFTLSFHDSERSRKPPMPIASVVMGKCKKKEKDNFKKTYYKLNILLKTIIIL